MQRSASYSNSHGAAGHSRYPSTHASSSAFSSSANPDEDWTKISDLAERRRIQNRIAQRNYRKKLKRRLEDLERRAASSSASPESSHVELASPPKDSFPQQQSFQTTKQQPSKSTPARELPQMSPDSLLWDDQTSYFDSTPSRHHTISSPPTVTYSTYPPTMAYLQSEYFRQPGYQGGPDYFTDYQYQYRPNNVQTLPPTLPTMLPTAYVKQENGLGDDEIMNPFSLNYASLAGLDLPANQSYSNANSHVNISTFLPRSYSSPYG